MSQRVLIVGGGDGGTILANTLDKHKFDVTVLSASDKHMFQPALLYVAFKNASRDIVRDERKLLDRRVRLVHDAAAHVDLNARVVTTASGQRHDYDYVVLGTGIHSDPGQIPGLAEVNAEYGDYHSSIAQAEKLWAKLDAFRGGTIVLGQSTAIIKCPPSPIEGILLTDELLRKRGLRDKTRLVFFTPYPRPYPAEPMNEIVEPILRERGIEVMTFFDVDRIDLETRTISSIEGDEVRYDLAIIIPPFAGAEISYQPTDVVDQDGFVITDRETLRVKGTETAFGIGDGTTVPTSKSGVAAHLEAKVIAKTLTGAAAKFNGRTNCPLDMAFGRGTFVVGSYDAPVVKSPPSRLKHLMKMTFARIYWLSLRGWLEPMFAVYFKLTEPKPAPKEQAPSSGAQHQIR
jgi:sulfide:quinone oxidoreductase